MFQSTSFYFFGFWRLLIIISEFLPSSIFPCFVAIYYYCCVSTDLFLFPCFVPTSHYFCVLRDFFFYSGVSCDFVSQPTSLYSSVYHVTSYFGASLGFSLLRHVLLLTVLMLTCA